MAVMADDFQIGNISYTIREGNTCSVSYYEVPDNVEPVVIPSSVTYGGKTYTVIGIDFYAFSDGTLETVEIPSTVKYIEYSAFENCTALTTVTGCAGLTRIDEDVFRGCEALKSVSLGDKLETIGDNVFNECSSLTTITGGSALKEIGNSAFAYCTSLTSFDFNEGLSTIGENAFEGSGLTSAKLPSTLKELPALLFYDCADLTSADLTALGAIFDNTDNFGESIFEGCSALKSARIPTDATIIPDFLFNNTGIEEFDFPATLTYIGQGAFSGTPIKHIVIPDNVWGIDEMAFYHCTSLETLDLGKGVELIGYATFQGCTNLTEVKVSPVLRSIDLRAFVDCKNISRVYISDLAAWCDIKAAGFGSRPGEETSEYYNMYLNGELLTTIDLPEGLAAVTDYSFNSVANITSITLPESLKTIGEWSFRALTEVSNNIVIPDNVTSIGVSAFWWNNNSKELTLGKKVAEIGDMAFGSWESLETVKCLNPVPPKCGDMVFSYISYLDLQVPAKALEAYKSDPYWGQFKSITALPYDGPEAPEHLYVIGAVKGHEWSTDNSPEMIREGDLFTATVTLTEQANFKFTTVSTETPNDWDGENGINKNMCYGQANDNTVITLGEEFNLIGMVGNVGALNTGHAGTFIITVDFSDPETPVCTVTEKEASICAPDVDRNAQPEYYTLQGIRISEPIPGQTVICRRGNAVTKIFVK